MNSKPKFKNKKLFPALPGVTDAAFTPQTPSADGERPTFCDNRTPEEKAASQTMYHLLDMQRLKFWKGNK